MKRFFTILFLFWISNLYPQSCLPEGIIFTSQAEIDSFNINYPGCTDIEGDVYVIGNDIYNLNGLNVLEIIEGSLIIGGSDSTGTSLDCLTGLYYLNSIGGEILISNNNILTSLYGLNNLESDLIQSLSIFSNPLLSTCDVPFVCAYLENPSGPILISDNAPDCNNPEEVITDCNNNCLTEGINFITQSQIDNFQANFPGCTEIIGYVTIDGNNISNLQGLNVLTTLHSRLLIGGFYPSNNNPNLINLNGLENLSSINGFLGIYWNTSLTSCTGLDNLTHIGGYFKLWGNENLTTLNGMESLTTVDENLYIRYNPSLKNLSGLNNLETIGDYLSIDLCDSLIDLTGLESIIKIGGDLYIGENYDLVQLTGLNTNDSILVEDKIYIVENPNLTDINGLANIITGSIEGLYIYDNPLLSECAVQNICDYLITNISDVEIYNNAYGCNSPEEVIDACNSCLPQGIIFSTQAQVDSFQFHYPECEYIAGNVSIIGYGEITNLTGLNVIISIGGDLSIINNYNLENLAGLENLSTISGDLFIEGNEILKNLTGLENINPNSINGLYIINNPLLSDCEIQSICYYLLNPVGWPEIYDNAPGCNSPEEVYDACWVSTNDIEENRVNFDISPNPANNMIIIKSINENFKKGFDFELRNSLGQVVYNVRDIHFSYYEINISDLQNGIYLYTIKEKGTIIQQGKLIKK